MGLYRYITEEETKRMKNVSNAELNELLQEALHYDDTLLIDEQIVYVKKGWLSKLKQEIRHTVYHEERAWDNTAYQAQYMTCLGNEEQIKSYLLGIRNGGEAIKRKHENK